MKITLSKTVISSCCCVPSRLFASSVKPATSAMALNHDFKGKVALITGSVAGIGRSTALLLAKNGASVTLHGFIESEAEEVKKEFAKEGIPTERVLIVMGLLEKAETRQKLVDETINRFGRLDILINNVGATAKPGEKDFFSLDSLRYILEVNVTASVDMVQLSMPHLMKTQGNVVNVSSTMSIRPSFIGQWYSVSKAALDSYTKVAASLYSVAGIRVNAVRVGAVNTTIYKKHGLPELTDRFISQVNYHSLLHRIGEPHEIANVIAFLADNNKATFVTGSIYEVDGGLSSSFITPPADIMEHVAALGYQSHGMIPKSN